MSSLWAFSGFIVLHWYFYINFIIWLILTGFGKCDEAHVCSSKPRISCYCRTNKIKQHNFQLWIWLQSLKIKSWAKGSQYNISNAWPFSTLSSLSWTLRGDFSRFSTENERQPTVFWWNDSVYRCYCFITICCDGNNDLCCTRSYHKGFWVL